MSRLKISIVGAGFSGLSLACLLAETDKFDITIFEKNQSSGGMIRSDKNEQGLVERAANSILLNDDLIEFLNHFNIKFQTRKPTAKARYFFKDRLRKWPLNVAETLQVIKKGLYHLITKKRNLIPVKDETLNQWGVRNFSTSFSKYLLGPAFQGIHALSPEQLDAELILSDLFSKKRKKYHGIVSGAHGVSDLIRSMENYLISKNVHFVFNTEYSLESDFADHKIICTSAFDATKLIEKEEPLLYKLMKQINGNNIFSVTAFFNDSNQRPKGFGCLIPDDQNIKALGVLFNSDIFENRSLPGLSSETYIFGGKIAHELNLLDNAGLQNEIIKIRQQVLKLNENPVAIYKNYWERGLPVYNINLKVFQKNINQLKRNKNIHLHGNYVAGIGLSKIFSHSKKIFNEILESHP